MFSDWFAWGHGTNRVVAVQIGKGKRFDMTFWDDTTRTQPEFDDVSTCIDERFENGLKGHDVLPK